MKSLHLLKLRTLVISVVLIHYQNLFHTGNLLLVAIKRVKHGQSKMTVAGDYERARTANDRFRGHNFSCVLHGDITFK